MDCLQGFQKTKTKNSWDFIENPLQDNFGTNFVRNEYETFNATSNERYVLLYYVLIARSKYLFLTTKLVLFFLFLQINTIQEMEIRLFVISKKP